VHDAQGDTFKFLSRIFINSAGLGSDKVSRLLGLDQEEYRLKYCKGDYFRVSSGKAKFINRLVYPVPKKERASLGIHATLDLSGSLRLGPDDEYVKEINYDIDPLKREVFYESTRQFLPFIELKDLNPDMAGIRPKLQGPEENFRDFIIKDETENGTPGFINLIGIESPGFTGSLSIAKMVTGLVKSRI
jgi:L-2-hydroxyglutarate oxidase LhgO